MHGERFQFSENFGSVNAIIFMLAIYFNLFDIVFVIHDIYHVIFSHVCHFHRALEAMSAGSDAGLTQAA